MIEYNLQNPKYPSVRIHKKNLSDIEFPISFKLCAKELKNRKMRYSKIGYFNDHSFFSGSTKCKGWNGCTETYKTLGSVEGTKYFRVFKIKFYPFRNA